MVQHTATNNGIFCYQCTKNFIIPYSKEKKKQTGCIGISQVEVSQFVCTWMLLLVISIFYDFSEKNIIFFSKPESVQRALSVARRRSGLFSVWRQEGEWMVSSNDS